MSEEGRRRGLGRGLSALLGEEGGGGAKQLRTVPIELLHPSRFQPRRQFDGEAMNALVESVRAQGILQPILVRPHRERANDFEILAGERRWRAAQVARLHEVPVVVREIADREALEIALVENIQRQDLGPLEEAAGYQRLIDEFGHTQEALAHAVGKSRSHVANMLRLLGLPEAVRRLVEDGKLSAGHARALLTAADPEALAREVVRRDLNVRGTEALARRSQGASRKRKRPTGKDADTRALERDLAETLGLKVTLELGERGGTLSIHYGTLEQLDFVLQRLKGS